MTSPRDLPAFEYLCSNGHALASSRPLEACPAVVKGSPCRGTLTRRGRGSRRAAA